MDTNIYQCPACGSKRISKDRKSSKENAVAASFLGVLIILPAAYLGWNWLILLGFILTVFVMIKMPLKLKCHSCNRRWEPGQVKVIGQVPKGS